jgi:hypothetical protein
MTDEWMGPRYRKPGVKWTIEEVPILYTQPKRIEYYDQMRKFVYDCEKCGKEFKMGIEIHIPWCIQCRNIELDKLIESGLNIPPKTTDKSLCKKCDYQLECKEFDQKED